MNTTTPYWIETAQLPHFETLTQDLHVDVAIIGGGITGITAAYLLKQAGKTVALLEKGSCADIYTGHTTAHLTCVSDIFLTDLVKNFGQDHAQAVWDAGFAAIDQIENLVTSERIDCEFSRVPGYLHAQLQGGTADERPDFKAQAAQAEKLGFEASYTDRIPFFGLPGTMFPNQAKFHPRKYVKALLEKIPGRGSYIFEHTMAEEVVEKPLGIKVGEYTVNCDYVIVATHVPLMGKTNLVSATLLQTKIFPYTSYALGAHVPKGTIPEALYWDTSDPYHYLRVDPKPDYDYIIFGGSDHKTGQAEDTEAQYNKLEKLLKKVIPMAQLSHRWSGQVIETMDGLPYIGETSKKQFVGTGFSGNGMTFGTLTAMMAYDKIMGRKNPWKELFHPDRKKIKGGAWDYLRENKDYPYYLVKTRLQSAEGTKVETLKPGEGRILELDGKKVAVSRAVGGDLHYCSAVCTHMGCLVEWNNAEKSWDCPCHGSRFAASGELIAGPAETALESVQPKSK